MRIAALLALAMTPTIFGTAPALAAETRSPILLSEFIDANAP